MTNAVEAEDNCKDSQVKIPMGLTVGILKLVEKGYYKNITEAVRDAIRRRLEELHRIGDC